MLSREEAASYTGIMPVPCLPTGVIMFDMEVFEITDPKHEYKRLREQGLSHSYASALTKPWFYYEWPDIYAADKASTEDVTCTRDIGYGVMNAKGYHPLFCNFDAWAGHMKPELVGKPRPLSYESVNEKYRTVAIEGKRLDQRLGWVRPNGSLISA